MIEENQYLERVVEPAPDVVPERPGLLRELEYAYPGENLLRLTDSEAVGVDERAVNTL